MLDNATHAREQLDKCMKMLRMLERAALEVCRLSNAAEEEKYFATRDNCRKMLSTMRVERERLQRSMQAADVYLTRAESLQEGEVPRLRLR
jgi:hypothetical protein